MLHVLQPVVRQYVAAHAKSHPNNSLFDVSLDHCPSEQLTGATWHTSALVISPAVEHAVLAAELGKELNPQTGSLTIWVKAGGRYRKRFLNAFAEALPRHPVLALCFCSREETIVRNENDFVSFLGIENHYQRVRDGKRDIARVGPFRRNGILEHIQVPANQALMALFIAYNIRRTRDCMEDEAQVPVSWNIRSDRPPNNFDGPLSKFTHLLIAAEWAPSGFRKYTWGGFPEDKNVDVIMLADNLAGAVADAALHGFKQSMAPTPSDGFFQVEIFE